MKKNLVLLLVVFFIKVMPLMADLYVGSNASGVSYTNSTNASYTNIYIGYGTGSDNNSLTITGSGVTLDVTNIYTAYDGTNNSLVINNGANLQIKVNSYLGYNTDSSYGSITVTNDSVFNINNACTNFIGYMGAYNNVTVSGSKMSNGPAFIGFSNTSSNNTVSIVNGSLWSNGESLYVGYEGAGNRLIVSNSSILINHDTNYIGGTSYTNSNSAASNNIVTIADSSKWTNYGPMYILSSGNQLNILSNSLVTNGSDFHIYYGSSNTVTVSNGSTLVNNWAFIGGTNNNDLPSTSSNNTINIGGSSSTSNSTWSNNGNLYLLGYNNQINITANGYLYVSDTAYIGSTNTNSEGNVVTVNSGVWSNAGNIYIGWTNDSYSSSATIIVTNGGQINADNLYLYYGALYVSDNTNALGTNMNLTLGTNNDGSALLYLSTGGTTSLNVKTLDIGSNVYIHNINPGQQTIHVSGELHNTSTSNVCYIYFVNNVSLNNNEEELLSCSNFNNFNSNISSNFLIEGISGYTLSTNSTNLLFQIATDANLTISRNINETNSLTISELNYNAGTATVSSNGSINATASITFGDFCVLQDYGTITTPTLSMFVDTLVISNGGKLFDTNAILQSSNGNTNSVTLTGTNSLWSNSENLYFGSNGGGINILTLENGATLYASNFIANATSGSNAITINDASLLGNNLILAGLSDLTASNQAQITFSNCILGTNGASNNLTIEGSGTLMTCNGYLIIGYSGASNNVLIESNAAVLAGNVVLGDSSNSFGNTLVVDDAILSATNTNLASTNTNEYRVIIGYNAAGNTLTITNGGVVSNSLGVIGYNEIASNNSAVVTGSNSSWINTNGFYVGFSGNNNSLTVSDGGEVLVNGPYSYIGMNSSSNTATITSNSIFSNSGVLNVGFLGSFNNLTISGGSQVIDSSTTNINPVFEPFAAFIGVHSNNNSVTVNSNASWINYGDVGIGYDCSSNILSINGGTVSDSNFYIGYATNASSDIIKLESNSSWNNSGDVFVGYAGAGNQVFATNGSATISSANIYIGYTTNSSNNFIGLNSTSVWNNTGNIYVGYDHSSNNSFFIEGGAVVTSSNTYVSYEGNSSSNNITVSGSGSLLSNSGVIVIGSDSGTGSMTVESNGMVVAELLSINDGKVYLGNTNSLSTTPGQLGGGSKLAELYLISNSTISSLNWKSNGLLRVQPGGTALTVTGAITNSDGGGGGFDFSETSLNNNTNTLVTYGSSSLAVNNYYATNFTGGIFTTNSNTVSYYLATNSVVTCGVNLTQTNEVAFADFTAFSNTATIATNGVFDITSNMTVTNTATIDNSGTMNIGNSLFIFSSAIVNNNSNSTINITNNLTNFYHITNFGIITAGNLFNNSKAGYITNSLNARIDLTNDFYNYGTVYNSGEIIAGDFRNYGTLQGSGTIIVTNTNTFHQDGILILDGLMKIQGNVVEGSEGTIVINSDDARLDIDGELKSDNSTLTVKHDLFAFHNDTNAIITYKGTTFTDADIVTPDVSGGTYFVNSQGVYEYFETNADVVCGADVLQNTKASLGNLILNSNAVMTITSNGDLTILTNLIVGNNETVNNNGNLTVNGDCTNLNSVFNLRTMTVHGDFIEGSNSILGLHLGDSKTDILEKLISADNTLLIDFSGTSLNNDTNVLITYKDTTVTNVEILGIIGGNSEIDSNSISFCLKPDADVASSINVIVTNKYQAAHYNITHKTTAIETNGTFTATSDLVIGKDGTLNNAGQLVVEQDLLNYNNVINTGTATIERIDNYGNIDNRGIMKVGDFYNHNILRGAGTMILTNSAKAFHQENILILDPGIMIFTGNFIDGNNAVTINNIRGTSKGEYGQHVINNGTLKLHGSYSLNFSGDYVPSYGQTLEDAITAEDGMTGSFSGVLSSLPNIRGRLVFTNNNRAMNVLLAPSNYALVAQTANEKNVAVALNSFIPATNGGQQTVSQPSTLHADSLQSVADPGIKKEDHGLRRRLYAHKQQKNQYEALGLSWDKSKNLQAAWLALAKSGGHGIPFSALNKNEDQQTSLQAWYNTGGLQTALQALDNSRSQQAASLALVKSRDQQIDWLVLSKGRGQQAPSQVLDNSRAQRAASLALTKSGDQPTALLAFAKNGGLEATLQAWDNSKSQQPLSLASYKSGSLQTALQALDKSTDQKIASLTLDKNENQQTVWLALDKSEDQQTVSLALDELTASQYPAAFEVIMPTLYQSLSTIAFNLANAQNNELIQRLWSLRIAGAGFTMNGFGDNMPLLQEAQGDKETKDDILIPGPDKHWGIFVDGNGIFAQANSGNMLPSYNSESGGVATGLSYQWNEHFSSGLYSGYEGSYTKYSGTAPGTLVDNAVRFGLFGTYGEPDGKGFYLNGLVGGAYNNYNMQRNISFGTINRTATGTPGAGELDTMLASGYDFKRNNWTFGPTTSLQYTYLGVNPFNESGAQSLDLDANGWNTSSMIYSLGSHVAYNWQVNKNLIVIPQVSLNWQHEFLQNPYAINSTLNGNSPTFSNWSSTPQRDSFFPSCSVMVALGDRWNTSLSYSVVAGNQDIISQNIFWNIEMKF